MKNNTNFSVNNNITIPPRINQEGIVVTYNHWDFIKNKLSNIKGDFHIFDKFGGIFLGIGINQLISLFYNKAELIANKTLLIMLFMAVAFCLLGIALMYIDHLKSNKHHTNNSLIVLEQMELIEKDYPKRQLDSIDNINHTNNKINQ